MGGGSQVKVLTPWLPHYWARSEAISLRVQSLGPAMLHTGLGESKVRSHIRTQESGLWASLLRRGGLGL